MRRNTKRRVGAPVRRFRVVTRPKVRSRRMAAGKTLLLAAAGVACVALAVKKFPRRYLHVPTPSVSVHAHAPSFFRVDSVSFQGIPPALEPLLAQAAGPSAAWGLSGPYRVERGLRAAFPCIEDVRFRRNWFSHAVTFYVQLRTPIARIDGAGETWIDASGVEFFAPQGVYDPAAPLPLASPGPADAQGLQALAGLIEAMSKPGALPSLLASVSFRSPEDGWEARLQDGTVLLWGGLNWTEQKLLRFSQVVSDANAKFSSGMTVDLRFFEDGKILVRPPAGAARAYARGTAGKDGLPARGGAREMIRTAVRPKL